jgi:hypothetical protein
MAQTLHNSSHPIQARIQKNGMLKKTAIGLALKANKASQKPGAPELMARGGSSVRPLVEISQYAAV